MYRPAMSASGRLFSSVVACAALLALSCLIATPVPGQEADLLDSRIDAIERLNQQSPWQESQAAIEALRAEGLSGASLEQRTRLDLLEARNHLLGSERGAALDLLNEILASAVPIDLRLRALELAANAAGIEQRYALAFNYLYEALKLLPDSDQPATRSGILVLASRFHAMAGEPALAMQYASEALAAARQTGDSRSTCFAEQDLVFLQLQAGLTGVAAESAVEMWADCQESGDPVMLGAGLKAMGAALHFAGRHDEAIGWLQRAIEQNRQSGFSMGVAESRYYLGLALLSADEFERGTELLMDSVQYFESREAWGTLIDLHSTLAESFEARELPGRALAHLKAQFGADERFNNSQRSLRIAYQQAEFENQRQQQELVLLRQRNELFELERQAQASRREARIVAIAMAGVIGALLIGLLIRFRADRRRFRRLSERDGLTGLLNHSRFHRAAGRALQKAHESGQPCTLIAADVDLFKQVNDRCGHQAGDAVLTYLGRVLHEVFSPPCIVGRVGGEEFAIFLPGQNRLQARQRIETLRRCLEPVVCGEHRIEVTLSFGIAEARRERRLERLRHRADEALYRAKRSGRDELIDAADLLQSSPA